MQINPSNYESFLLSYVDGELTDTEKREVEIYCQANPDAARDLELLRQTVMTSSLTEFEHKETLYREEEPVRVVGWYLWRAAVIVVLLSGGFFFLYSRRHVAESDSDKQTAADSGKKAVEHFSADNKSTGSGNTADDTTTSASVAKIQVEKKGHDATGRMGSGEAVSRNRRSVPDTVSDFKAGVAGIHSGAKTGNRKKETGNKNSSPVAAGTPGQPPADKAEVAYTDAGDDTDPALASAGPKRLDLQPATTMAFPAPHSVPAPSGNRLMGPAAGTVDSLKEKNETEPFDRPAGNETAMAEGNDAISILHLSQNKGVVGKFFRRMGGGKESRSLAEDHAAKKVSISVFRFAVGK